MDYTVHGILQARILEWLFTRAKEFACNAGGPGSIPGSGRSLGEGNGYPLQYSGLENSMDCIAHGVTKSRTLMSNFHFQSEVRLQFIPLGSDHIPIFVTMAAAATAAKLLQSCSTLCDPKDGGPPGYPVPGILQARTLEWVAISFSNA